MKPVFFMRKSNQTEQNGGKIVFTYFTVFADSTHKDNPLTKIYVLIVSALIIALLFTAYIFVYKQEGVSLTNGRATLWDTKTVELADEICADCDTDEEKVKTIYYWITMICVAHFSVLINNKVLGVLAIF